MDWEWSVIGFVFSILAMLLLAMKWKLPKLSSLAGIIAVSLAAAMFSLWIYPLCGKSACASVAISGQIVVALILGFSLILLRFWRDPERVPPEEEGVVLSAADGKVISVRTVDKGSMPLVRKSGNDYLLRELTGTSTLASEAHIIDVEMNFLDVHVTRCPISGKVKLQKDIEGKFISLRRDDAPFINARLTTIIENASLTVTAVQVASRLVRHVESYRSEGEMVRIGQRLGMIRFGSLVAVVLPNREGVRIEVKPGDRVTAGVSVLARYENNPEKAEI
jgi:phosphatidylserine decarboxylase